MKNKDLSRFYPNAGSAENDEFVRKSDVGDKLLPENPEDGAVMTAKDGEWLVITKNYYTEGSSIKRYSDLIPQEVSSNNIHAEIMSQRDYNTVTENLHIIKNGFDVASSPTLVFKNSNKDAEGQTFKSIDWTCVNRTDDKYSCKIDYTPFPKVNKFYNTPTFVNLALVNALTANASTIISSTSTVKTSIDITDSDFMSDITDLHSKLDGDYTTFYPQAPICGISILRIIGYCTISSDVSLGGKIITTTQAMISFSGTWLKMVIALEILSDKISIHIFTDKV